MNAAKVLEDLKRRFPNEPEYHQAVEEVLATIEEEYNKHPEFDKANLIERLCIPDRIYQFRVTWWMTKATCKPTWDTVCSTTTLSARIKAASASMRP
ncbi:NAD-specific glutamate dehydrogenase [Bacteroides pyogenes JCM 10003]|nr:NAD-specific glutamate dehydrogenase [Bacteroides pyogenes JCM 10003]